jgi:hypothetical protein
MDQSRLPQTARSYRAPVSLTDVLSDTLIKNLSRHVFRRRQRPVPSAAEEQVLSAVLDADAMDEDPPPSAQALISTVPGLTQGALTGNAAKMSDVGTHSSWANYCL